MIMIKENKIIVITSAVLLAVSIFVGYKALDYRRHVNYFLDKYTNVVTEFSGRDKYRQDNVRVAAATDSIARVVFIGDQIIENWPLERYIKKVQPLNRGITGQRLEGFLLRFRSDVIDLKPRAVVIQFSSYNFRPQNAVKDIKDDIVSLADLARFNKIEPILTTVIPVRRHENKFESESFPQSYAVADTLKAFNNWLADYCRVNDVKLLDFNGALKDDKGFLPESLSFDNTHLNAAGFDRLAEAANKVLAELLAPPTVMH